MSENIAARVSRIVSGTANMLVDAVENMAPEMVMEEAIREVDRAIDDVRAELGQVLTKQHLAARRLAEESRKHDELSEKIRIALGEGREELAEAGVAQVLDIEAQIPVLEMTIADSKESEAQLEGYVSALQARKREMKDELAQYREAAKTVAGTSSGADGPGKGGSPANRIDSAVHRAEAAFERVMEQAGGVAGSATVPDVKTSKQRAELDELARQNRIKERLEAFKT